MSDDFQKLRPARAEPSYEAKWPKWIADALAHRPESPTPVGGSPTKAVPPEVDERRNIRLLTRVPNT